MPEPVWFRSLYWRIAIGFVAMLAVVLSAQAVLFLWLTGRFTASPSSRTPQALADQVARDVSDALSDNFGLQLDAYVRERYADVSQPFVVAMRDGRRAANRPNTLPPGFLERLPRRGGPPFGDGGRGGPPPGARGPQGEHVPPPPGDRPGFRRDEIERGAGGP